MSRALIALRDSNVSRRGKGLPPLPRAPILACGSLPPLRSGWSVLTKSNSSRKIKRPASLRSMVFTFGPEWCSASLRNAVQLGRNPQLGRFRWRLARLWRYVLHRRSQKSRVTRNEIGRVLDRWIPAPRTLHPYPNVRLDARIQGRSRMRYVASRIM
jgi:hypothetical protein